MRIRRARLDEANALAAVHVESWRTTYAELLPQAVIEQANQALRKDQWQEWLDLPDDGLFIYVAETANGIDGFIACGPRRSSGEFDGEILALYLRQSAQRRGIGRALMKTAATRLRNSGARSMGLMVLAANPAREFYQALGGRCTGEVESLLRGHACLEATYVWDDINRLCAEEPHWCSYGEGPPVVLVHGWTGDGDFWELQLDSLRKRSRVVTLDLPGHGASPAPAAEYSMDLFSEAVREVMDRAGLQSAILAGHSMGGVIAHRVAQRWPERVRALALIDTPFALSRTSYFDDKARAFEGADGHAARLRTVRRMFSAQADETAKHRVLAAVMATPDAEAAKMFRTMTRNPNAEEPALAVPVLAIPATGTTMGDQAFLHRMFPLLEYHPLECGHFVTLERPVELNELLLNFVRKFHGPKGTAPQNAT